MGKLVLRKAILRNMIDRVWAALKEEHGLKMSESRLQINTFRQNME
jgi:hypothetical protein